MLLPDSVFLLSVNLVHDALSDEWLLDLIRLTSGLGKSVLM